MPTEPECQPATSSKAGGRASFLLDLSRRWLPILLLCSWASWYSIGRGFIGDDFAYVARFSQLSLADWPSLFFADWSGGIWGYDLNELRPVAALTFIIDGLIGAGNPTAYHVTNTLLYIICTLAVGSIYREVLPKSEAASITACALFAVFPAHAEPLAWITGRVDILSALFVLWGVFCALRAFSDGERPIHRWLCLLLFLIGLYAKENAAVMPLLVVLAASIRWRQYAGHKWKTARFLAIGCALVVAGYAVSRSVAFGSMASGRTFSIFSSGFLERQVDYLGWLFPPMLDLVRANRTTLTENAPHILASAALAFVLASFAAVYLTRERQRMRRVVWTPIVFTGLWYLATILPLADVTYFSPRHVFLCSAGFVIAFVAIVFSTGRHTFVSIVLSAVSLGVCARLFLRETLPWVNSARVSEKLLYSVIQESRSGMGRLLILDAPSSFQGAWCWSWSSPFALSPPHSQAFGEALESPESYFLPDSWATHREPRRTASTAADAVLISVDPNGQVTRQLITKDQLASAIDLLPDSTAPFAESSSRWRQFVMACKEASQHPSSHE